MALPCAAPWDLHRNVPPRGATAAAAQALSGAPFPEPALILQALTGILPSSADPATVRKSRQNRGRAFTSPSQRPPRHHGEHQRETPNKRGQSQHPGQLKDTVPTDEEDDEVDADDHPRRGRAPVRHDAVVHHSIPVFTCQNLRSQYLDQPVNPQSPGVSGAPWRLPRSGLHCLSQSGLP